MTVLKHTYSATALHCTALLCFTPIHYTTLPLILILTLHYTVLYCILSHNAIRCTVLHCTVLYCSVLYCITFYPIMPYAVLYYTVLYCTVLHHILPHNAMRCTVLHCTVLYYTTFYPNAMRCTVLRCNLIESSATTLTAGSTITLSSYTDDTCSTVSATQSTTIGSCTKDDDNSYSSVTTSGSGSGSGSVTPATTSSSSSNSLKACFAGSETVTLLSGEVISISEVRVGDRVLAADSARQTVFSEVVYVPHGANADKTVFTHITTTRGRDIKMTHSHILPAGACGSTSPLPDVYASSVTVGDCIMTVSGIEEVSAVETVQGQGLYTIVTKEEYVVVNGIIASPFAYNHMLANCYYNIHRFFYALLPGLSGYPLIGSAYEVRRA